MSQETSLKYGNLKKRVKLAVGKSVKSSRNKDDTLRSKKRGFQANDGVGQTRRVRTDRAVHVDEVVYRRKEDSGRSNVKSKNGLVRGNEGRLSNGVQSRRGEGVNGSYVDNKMLKREDRGRGSRAGKQSYSVRSKIAEDDEFYAGDKMHKWEDGGRGFKSNYRDRSGKGVQGNLAEASGKKGFKAVNSDRKRKRIYADNDTNGESMLSDNVKEPGGKRLSREQISRSGSHDAVKQRRHSNEKESTEERGGKSLKATGRHAGKVSVAEQSHNRNGLLKEIVDGKYYSSKQLHRKLKSYADDYESGKKKFQSKKSSADESMVSFDRPRRKRRVIRIEYPNDITNKKLDDSRPTIDNTRLQKEDSDTDDNAEMSKNAQFRAIQPSPSIVSFVQENLLGRRREIEFRKAGYNIELPAPLDNIPFSTSSERERVEESVFRNKLEFFAAAKVSSSFPSPDLPEIAFAGRSNVGKSSLLNSLTRQWGVVRTSDKPGLTQTINFFNVGSKLCLVDLPGYGFAYAKEEVKESWEELVKEYVSTRAGLKRVCLLIDTKWGMKPRDHELIDLMESSKTKYQIVLTKTDLSFPVDVARRAMQIEESLKTKKSVVQPLMMVSSKTGAGIRSLRTVLSNISRFARL